MKNKFSIYKGFIDVDKELVECEMVGFAQLEDDFSLMEIKYFEEGKNLTLKFISDGVYTLVQHEGNTHHIIGKVEKITFGKREYIPLPFSAGGTEYIYLGKKMEKRFYEPKKEVSKTA